MRRRLINSTLAVVLVVIAVFGISLVIVESRTIETSAKDSVQSDAVQLVGVVENRLVAGEPVSPRALSRQIDQDRYAVIRVPGQPDITLGRRQAGKVISATRMERTARAPRSPSPATR